MINRWPGIIDGYIENINKQSKTISSLRKQLKKSNKRIKDLENNCPNLDNYVYSPSGR